MLHHRIEGLSLLHGIAKLVLFPFWSLAVLAFGVGVLDMLNYSQINFPVYFFGILAAFLIGLNFRLRPEAGGPRRKYWVAAIRQSNIDILILGFVIFAIIYATKDQAISRQFVALYLVLSWGGLVLLNRFLPSILSDLFFQGKAHIPTLFVGSVEQTKNILNWANDQRRYGLFPVGLAVFSEAELKTEAPPMAIIGTIRELGTLLKQNDIQQLVLLDSRDNASFVQYIVDHCQDAGCRLLVSNPWESFLNQPLVTVAEGDHSFFTLGREPLQNPANRVLKRTLDLIVSIPVCLFLLPCLAVLVKFFQWIQSPGPLIIRQDRTGREKQKFRIFKFRTMHVGNEKDENRQASAGDNRIYPFGGFLRKTSLDEIPQFINVLTGGMSVVGPRPHLIQHDDQFARQIQIYRNRHHVKPGITGMAQHLGFRGEIKTAEDIENRIALDLQYINNWSIWLDIGIILKTAWQVFFPPAKAY